MTGTIAPGAHRLPVPWTTVRPDDGRLRSFRYAPRTRHPPADGHPIRRPASRPSRRPRAMTTHPTPADDTPVRHELTVVMPVYNEADGLGACLASWRRTLDDLGIDHRILVLDDGSTDATTDVLAGLAGDDRIEAVSKANEGHGPTVLRGYEKAVADADWVFQVDSDDEIPAEAFGAVWVARTGHDAVFGYRTGRTQPIDRRIISRVAAVAVRRLFGSKVRDVNVPYRLLRAEALAPVLVSIPADTFSRRTWSSRASWAGTRRPSPRCPCPHTQRRTGQVSIAGFGALRAASRSLGQTIRLAWRVRGAGPQPQAGAPIGRLP